ncbi:hypothetical protein AB0M46_21515 [Dactylosporangium sp. NPDC051485]|uniref:hypothetical protein n=1 Tax=Dactylosporangium sp. NPDC051485 TaxID=3154846 RepID=UPI003433300B
MTSIRASRWLAPAAAAVVVAAISSAAVVLQQAADTSAASTTGSSSPPTALPTPPSAGTPAVAGTAGTPVADPQAVLRRLAGHLQAAATDGRHGAFEYVSTRVAQLTGPPTATGATGDLAMSQVTSWTSTRGSGRSVTYAVPDSVPVCPPTSDETWDEPHPMDGPLEGTPDALLERLVEPGSQVASRTNFKGVDLFGQISELAATRILPRDTRAALLQLLAVHPDVEVRVDVRDPLGRPGIAVSMLLLTPFGPDPVQRTLIFDAGTGELLAAGPQFQTAVPPTPAPLPAAEPAAGIPRAAQPGLLVTSRAYTTGTHTPAPPCSTPTVTRTATQTLRLQPLSIHLPHPPSFAPFGPHHLPAVRDAALPPGPADGHRGQPGRAGWLGRDDRRRPAIRAACGDPR